MAVKKINKIKSIKGKTIEFSIDNKLVMEFYKTAKYLILLNEKGDTKTLVLYQ